MGEEFFNARWGIFEILTGELPGVRRVTAMVREVVGEGHRWSKERTDPLVFRDRSRICDKCHVSSPCRPDWAN